MEHRGKLEMHDTRATSGSRPAAQRHLSTTPGPPRSRGRPRDARRSLRRRRPPTTAQERRSAASRAPARAQQSSKRRRTPARSAPRPLRAVLACLAVAAVAEAAEKRRAQAYDLNGTAAYDTARFAGAAQVARDTAAFLSTLEPEQLTPALLRQLLANNLLQFKDIYGSCIAFEPDSYGLGLGAKSASLLRGGVPSANGTDKQGLSFWNNLAQPWVLPQTELCTNGPSTILYAPYMARGPHWSDGVPFLKMDLADGYNYFDPSTSWYHEPRQAFFDGTLSFSEGSWSDPYFDEGAGGIVMVTYSVPFWRKEPVPLQNLSLCASEAHRAIPQQRKLIDESSGEARYFWGIATIDIDIRSVSFECKVGEVYNATRRECERCRVGFFVSHGACVACEEWQTSSYDFTGCKVYWAYVLSVGVFYISLFAGTYLMLSETRRKFYILDTETIDGKLCLTTTALHRLSLSEQQSARRMLPVILSGCRSGELKQAEAFVKVVAENMLQLVGSNGEPFALKDADESPYLRGLRLQFPLEFGHTSLLFVPLGFWIVFFFCGAAIFGGVSVGLFGLQFHTGHNLTVVCVSCATLLAGIARLVARVVARRKIVARRKEKVRAALFEHLENASWDRDSQAEAEAVRQLLAQGLPSATLTARRRDMVKRQSDEAGVGLEYLLSDEFTNLASARSGRSDPNFYDLRDVFFFGANAIGRNVVCPRDGQLGCAYVDTLLPPHRRGCTHFLSWTWRYTVFEVQSALTSWNDRHLQAVVTIESDRHHIPRFQGKVYLYMCFFVNNQYRLLAGGDVCGSDNLESVFEVRLTSIGRMVALLDNWDEPAYLTRIWTIFEQFTSVKLGITVEMVMPPRASESLIAQIRLGEEGILRVKDSLCRVDSMNAQAANPRDEAKVKRMITQELGFDAVDAKVKDFLLAWVGRVVQEYMRSMMRAAGLPGATDGSPLSSHGPESPISSLTLSF